MPSPVWDVVLMALAWLLGLLALLLVAWALFWDRARGRKRCPKCWYDMSGTGPGEGGVFVCPECGKCISSERKLRKTRRRWGFTLVALVLPLGLGAYVAHKVPEIRERGWIAAAPTTLLILAAPEDELAAWFEHGTGAAVIDELLVRQEDVAPWQIDLLARRIPPADPAHVVRAHATREVVRRVNSPASAPSLMLVLAHIADELAFQRSDPQPPLCYRKFQGVWIIAAEPEVQSDYAALLALLLGEPEACTVVELCSIDQAAAFVPDTGSEKMLAALERAYPERGLVYAFGCTGGRVFIGSEDWISVLAAALRETIRQEGG